MNDKQIANKQEQWRTPACDIIESSESYTVALDMPGVEEKNLEITFQNGSLLIVGKVTATEHDGARAARREYAPCSFRREFALSQQSVDVDKISAELRDGELLLKLPKSEAEKPRRIEVKAG